VVQVVQRAIEGGPLGQLELAHRRLGHDWRGAMQGGQHVHEPGSLLLGDDFSEPTSRPIKKREHAHGVSWAEATERIAAGSWDRCHNELQGGLVPEGDGRVHRHPQTLKGGFPRRAEPRLVVQVVDGHKHSTSIGVTHDPVVATATNCGVLRRHGTDAPTFGQRQVEFSLIDSLGTVPHDPSR
jgi:hypothetical protein